MLKDVGMEVPKGIETKSKFSMHADNMIACMLNFDFVSIPFGTSIPTSFNILVKMFLHLFHWFLLCVATCINLLAFVLFYLPCIPMRIASNWQ